VTGKAKEKAKRKAEEEAEEEQEEERTEKLSGYPEKNAVGGDKTKMEGKEKEKEKGEEREKMTVEDIGTVVKDSGFKPDAKVIKSSVALLESLEDFMTIEGKNGESTEDRVRKLEREGILTKEQAVEALAKAKDSKEAAGGIVYDENSRKSINFSRTTVKHVIRLLNAIVG